ncbi:hypothetical protein ES703_51946 [subsurface metagenome]
MQRTGAKGTTSAVDAPQLSKIPPKILHSKGGFEAFCESNETKRTFTPNLRYARLTVAHPVSAGELRRESRTPCMLLYPLALAQSKAKIDLMLQYKRCFSCFHNVAFPDIQHHSTPK